MHHSAYDDLAPLRNLRLLFSKIKRISKDEQKIGLTLRSVEQTNPELIKRLNAI